MEERSRRRSAQASTTDAVRDRLIGDWTLVSYEAEHRDGRRTRPYGEAVGRLSYSASGHMAGQVMRPGREPVGSTADRVQSLRPAYLGYIAYFGTYELNDRGDTVVHHVQGALNPEWVGGQQVRRIRFDGDRLILRADVQRPEGAVDHVLTWRRLARE